jgi:hypothetical protein
MFFFMGSALPQIYQINLSLVKPPGMLSATILFIGLHVRSSKPLPNLPAFAKAAAGEA